MSSRHPLQGVGPVAQGDSDDTAELSDFMNLDEGREVIAVGEMIKAEAVEAIFGGRHKRQDQTYTFTRPVELCYSDDDDRVPQGMYLNDSGDLLSAESHSNFKGYKKRDPAPVVIPIPACDLYAVYRESDGTLTRTSVPVILVDADGALRFRDFDADGIDCEPTEMANFVAFWRESWGDEPVAWQKQDTFFQSSGGSPPERV
jgi:hypothetical protein